MSYLYLLLSPYILYLLLIVGSVLYLLNPSAMDLHTLSNKWISIRNEKYIGISLGQSPVRALATGSDKKMAETETSCFFIVSRQL